MCIEIDGLNYCLDENNSTAELVSGKIVFDNIINYPGKDKPGDKIFKIRPEVENEGKKYAVTSVSDKYFDRMEELEILEIPKSIISLKWDFYRCHSLKRFYVAKENRCYYDIDGVLFAKKNGLKSLFAFPNQYSDEYTIPEDTEVICGKAFKSCSNLKKVIIPSSVKKMGVNVFYDCGSLDIYLPDDFNIKQEYWSQNSHHYNKLRFHLCGEVYSVNDLNSFLDNKSTANK